MTDDKMTDESRRLFFAQEYLREGFRRACQIPCGGDPETPRIDVRNAARERDKRSN